VLFNLKIIESQELTLPPCDHKELLQKWFTLGTWGQF